MRYLLQAWDISMWLVIFPVLAISAIFPVASSSQGLPQGARMRLGGSRWCLTDHLGMRYGLAFCPDGTHLAVAGHESIRIFDAKTGEVLRDLCGGLDNDFISVAMSNDSKFLAATRTGGTVTLWEVKTWKQIRVWPDPAIRKKIHVHHIAFSPDGKLLVASGNNLDKEIEDREGLLLWDTATGKLIRTIKADSMVMQVGFGQKGNSIYALTESRFTRWPTDGNAALGSFPLPELLIALPEPSNCCVNHDGTMLAFNLKDAGVVFLDPTTGKHIGKVKSKDVDPEERIGFSWDGHALWTVSDFGGKTWLREWKAPAGDLIREFSDPQAASGIPISTPDSKSLPILINSTRPARIVTYDLDSGKPRFARVGHNGVARSGAFSPDGRAFLSVGDSAWLWNLQSGQPVRQLSADFGRFDAAEAGRDGRSFFLGSADGLKSMDMKSGIADRSLSLSGIKSFSAAAIYANSKKSVSALFEQSQELKLAHWDIATGKLIETIGLPPAWKTVLGRNGRIRICVEKSNPKESLYALAVYEGLGRQLRWQRRSRGNNYDDLAAPIDGDCIATVCSRIDRDDGISALQVWELATGEERMRVERKGLGIDRKDDFFINPKFSPDGRFLGVGCGRNTIAFFDTYSGRELGRITGLARMTPLAFSADGRQFATAVADGTILIWDVAKFTQRLGPQQLSPSQLEEYWRLLGADAKSAAGAMIELQRSPSQTLTLFKERLKPIEPVPQARLKELIGSLGSSVFATREAARRELAKYGARALTNLQSALKDRVDAETRTKIETLLAEIPVARHPDVRRYLRAIELLLAIKTPEANKLLEEWAGGDPTATETQAAKLAIER